MHKRKFIVLIITITLTNLLFGQQQTTKNAGSITGKVFDESTKKPVEFSNVLLLSAKDNKLVSGTVTAKSGEFNLKNIKPGSYNLQVQFVGYTTRKINGITVTNIKPALDLGKIYIKPTAINLQNVVVEGRRSPISYELDKKVIDVSQMHTAISGTAADVLQNVPSVSVDIDGTVSLRGSTNFQVLIDGRPSVMSAQDALQQIPASSIQNIEIMTNPSAKYDASGTAGIINIILKKNSNLGLSGIADLTGGLNDKYGGDFLFQYRTPSFSYNFGADFNRRTFPGSNRQEKQFIIGDNTSYLNSDGVFTWQRIVSGIQGGIGFDLSGIDNITLSGRYGTRAFHRNSSLDYSQWSIINPQKFYYLDNTNHNHSGTFYDLNAHYIHKFGPEGNELTGDLSFRHNNSNEASLSASVQSVSQVNGTKTTELGPQNELRGRIDYTLPIGKSEKFSAGSEFFSRVYQDINKLYVFDTLSSIYQFQPLYSHTNDFNRTRFAAYSIFSNQWDSLGVQVGFRTEYTYQLVKLAETGEQFSLSRWDYFPSIHASYNFAGGTQIMASYTRRIDRPDGGDLEPFYSWFDANNVHIGNPQVKPELIDSYEIGYQTFFGKVSFSNDFYFRFTHDKREDINSVYAEDVTLRTVANVGTDQSLGAEFMILFNPIELWQLNLMGDLYDYKISGAVSNESFARESFNWSVKANNVFKLSPTTELQLNTRYFSPSVTAQGKWNGFFITDLGVKQDIIEKKLSLTLQVSDLFKTGKREFTSQGIDFYNYNYFTRQAPMVMLNLKYNFNNYKEEKQQGGDQQDNSGNGGGNE